MLLMDTHAWVEYFKDSPNAGIIKRLMTGKSIYTSILSIAEFRLWALRNGIDDGKYLQYIEENSSILHLDRETALLAAKVKFNASEKDFGLVDALIYSTAVTYGLTVVSGDPHFKGLKNAIAEWQS